MKTTPKFLKALDLESAVTTGAQRHGFSCVSVSLW